MRKTIGLWFAVAVLLGGCVFFENIEKVKKLTIDKIAITNVKDGEYTATEDYTPVTAKLTVKVLGGRITTITISEHSHGPDHGADAIADKVVAAQSLDVDIITGATYSSKVILKCIETALRQGLK